MVEVRRDKWWSTPSLKVIDDEAARAAGTRDSCACRSCTSGCFRTPGWFLPGEAEVAAAYLGMSFEEFSREHLLVEWNNPDKGKSLARVLSPRKVGRYQRFAIQKLPPLVVGEPLPEGAPPIANMSISLAAGHCTFLNEDMTCAIHPVRPHECREAFHEDYNDEPKASRLRWRIIEAWEAAGAPYGRQGNFDDQMPTDEQLEEPEVLAAACSTGGLAYAGFLDSIVLGPFAVRALKYFESIGHPPTKGLIECMMAGTGANISYLKAVHDDAVPFGERERIAHLMQKVLAMCNPEEEEEEPEKVAEA